MPYRSLVSREIDEELLQGWSNIPMRLIRDRLDPFDYLSEAHFRTRYRMSRSSFAYICENIMEAAPESNRNSPMSVSLKLGIFIRCVAQQNFLLTSGDLHGVSKSSAARAFHETLQSILANSVDYLQWPSATELEKNYERFHTLTGIPGITGAIDGTHVRIQRPSEKEWEYLNRKNYHSLNVGAVCDSSGKFIWLSTSFPGRAHDSRVFKESTLFTKLKSGANGGILLADSAYAAEMFILKPIIKQQPSDKENNYTNAVCRGRVLIENAFGCLKRQWHSLHSELRVAPRTAAEVIYATVVLRNICVIAKEPAFTDEIPVYEMDPDPSIVDGSSLQSHVLDTYF